MHPWLKNTGRFCTGTTFAGAAIGFCEGRHQHAPPLYSMLLYAALWAIGGGVLGALVAGYLGARRTSVTTWGALVAAPLSTLVLVRFIVFRDVFMEAPERQLTALAVGVAAAGVVALGAAALGFT